MARVIEEWAGRSPHYVPGESRQLRIGMTLREAVDAWGMPMTFNRTCRRHGCFMQYVYPGGRYIYLRNDNPNHPDLGYRVVGWQD